MIARIWPGAVRTQDAPAYAAYVQRTGIDDDQFLIERDLTVNHYEVASTG